MGQLIVGVGESGDVRPIRVVEAYRLVIAALGSFSSDASMSPMWIALALALVVLGSGTLR
jgi:hypothetical protein